MLLRVKDIHTKFVVFYSFHLDSGSGQAILHADQMHRRSALAEDSVAMNDNANICSLNNPLSDVSESLLAVLGEIRRCDAGRGTAMLSPGLATM
ncbi:hypothetical protein MHYP_G00183890 [Metynnis hypsauchen]